MHAMHRKIFFIASLLLSQLTIQAQDGLLNVFVDCPCDMNYIRQEINYVNYVRDQSQADVQLFVNTIRNGSGGRSYALDFRGKADFEHIKKQLKYETTPIMTRDEVRSGLAQKISLGLVYYMAETDMAELIKISVPDDIAEKKTMMTVTEDPWNNWIFEIYGQGEFETESNQSELNYEFGLEIDRVTEDWRIRADVEASREQNEYNSSGNTFSSLREDYAADGGVVRSLSDHWSAGVFAGLRHSTFRNLDLSYYFQPALEYNIFPYREVMRREITFAYRIGYVHNKYLEETIFGHMQENLYRHSLDMQVRFRQPWGDIYTNIEASSYLEDMSKNRFELDSYVSVRLFKGLSLRFSTSFEVIRDQLTLPGGESSIEDILLKQRQIATDYKLGAGIGLSYTFGSAFNNIVNTRL